MAAHPITPPYCRNAQPLLAAPLRLQRPFHRRKLFYWPGSGRIVRSGNEPRSLKHGIGPDFTARKLSNSWTSSAQSLLITVVIAIFVITFAVQAFQIPSESMERTLLVGDYLLVDKLHYGPPGIWDFLLPYRPIRQGDIVVFHYPVKPSDTLLSA